MTKTTTSAPKDTAEKVMKTAQETVEKTVKAAQANVEKAVKEATTNLDSATEFSKANYEALVEAGNNAVKLAQTVNKDFMETSKKAVEKNVADMKALFAVKTPAEFFELQATIFKDRYEEAVSETTRLNEVASKTTNELIAPLKARYKEVAEKYDLPVA